MIRQRLNKTLQNLAKRRRWCVSDATLRAFFPGESRNTFNTAMSRHVRASVLQRASPGLFLNPYSPPPPYALEMLAGYLRPNDSFYLSLEAALHEHGLLSQIPNRLTFMTSGFTYTYMTALGVLEFVHTNTDPDTWRQQATYDDARKFHVASPQLALDDLKQLDRNIDLIDVEIMED
jgi:hypothetical protein